MNSKKSSGFTLIELIVAIAIMGVLLIIALPQVAKIQSNNKERKYEAYQQSMERAAKLYTDSNEKDLFGYYTSGCSKVTFDDLKKANLLKDIQIKDISCDSNNTYVYVKKLLNNEYKYEVSIECQKEDEEIVYSKLLNGECDTEKHMTPPEITINILNYNNNYVKEIPTIKVTISDDYYLYKNTEIKYYFVKEGTTTPIGGKKYTKNFGNKSNTKKVSFTIPAKNYPTQFEGDILLVVEPVSVKDMVNNNRTENQTSRVIKFDNKPPTCSVSGGNASWTNNSRTITATCHDEGSKCVTSSFSTTYSTDINTTKAGAKGDNNGGQVCDNAGNCEDCLANQTVKVDRTAPTITISAKKGTYNSTNTSCSATSTAYSGGWSNAGCISYSVSISDNYSLANATYAKSGFGNNASGNISISNNSATQTSYMRAEGTGTVTITAKDAAGNTATRSFTMGLDRTKPTITISEKIGTYNSTKTSCSATSTAYSGGWSNAGCISYSTSISDNYSLANATYAKSGFGNNASGNISISNNSATQTSYMRAEGTGTVTITAKDAAGNERTETFTMKLDRTAPVFEKEYSKKNVSINNQNWNYFGYYITDGLSGVDKNTSEFEYCYKNHTNSSCGATCSSGNTYSHKPSNIYPNEQTERYYQDANFDENEVYPLKAAVLSSCIGTYEVRTNYKICDKAGNCGRMHGVEYSW